nr:polyprenyl synthetase family protein [Bacteroidota bacterium]
VKVYDLLITISSDKLNKVISSFNKCAAEVCEGQQFDMNFESRQRVSEVEYLEMITLKTAVLLGFSLELGATLGGADAESCRHLYDFGKYIGLGFQLKDDLLDVYADKSKFGKQVGGDIISNKKTFLLIKALEKASDEQRQELQHWLSLIDFDIQQKVQAIITLYNQLEIKNITENKINEYFDLGLKSLEQVKTDHMKKKLLTSFVNYLNNREK